MDALQGLIIDPTVGKIAIVHEPNNSSLGQWTQISK